MGFNIAIDGPAGAGKSTIARRLADRLHFIYVDTGAMYRALAYYFLCKGIDYNDEEAVIKEVKHAEVNICHENGEQQVLLNGKCVNEYIRTEEVGNIASKTSTYQSVRAHLLQLQRNIAQQNDIIMDGRDIGTCVLPNAEVKVFLTASVETRAQRRYEQLIQKGQEADLTKIAEGIKERDTRDYNRKHAPLKCAEDATLIDSSYMTIEDVIEEICSLVKKIQN